MKRVWICAILTAMLVLVSIAGCASADSFFRMETAQQYVIYYPITREEAPVNTMAMVAKIVETKYGATVIQAGNENDVLTNNYEKIFNAQTGNDKNALVAKRLLTQKQLTALPLANADEGDTAAVNGVIWLLLYGNTSSFDAAFQEQLNQMIRSSAVRVNLIVVGDSVSAAMQGVMDSVTAEGIRNTCVYRIKGDITADTTSDPDVHTVDWFIASMYGTPVDLPCTASEDGNTYSFVLPANGSALFLTRQSVSSENTFNSTNARYVEFKYEQGKNHWFFEASYMPTATATEWQTIVTAPDVVKAYYFPFDDVTELGLKLDDGSASVQSEDTTAEGQPEETVETPKWSRNEHTVQLLIDEKFNELRNRDTFTASMIYQHADANDGIMYPEPVITLSSENNWAYTVSGDNVNNRLKHAFQATVSLTAADGNGIFTWTSDEFVRELQAESISLQSAIKNNQEIDVYYDSTSSQPAFIAKKWKEIFQYNERDNVEFSFCYGDGTYVPCEGTGSFGGNQGDDAGLIMKWTTDGFKLSAGEANSTCPVEEVKLKVRASNEVGECIYTLTVTIHDAAALWQNVQYTLDSADAAEEKSEQSEDVPEAPLSRSVHVSDTVSGKVTIPSDAVSAWNIACEQDNLTLPAIENMQIRVSDQDGNEIFAPASFMQQDDGSYSVEWSYAAAATGKAQDSTKLTVELLTNDEGQVLSDEIRTETYQINIANDAPVVTIDEKAKTLEIELKGWPWDVQASEDLITEAFGDQISAIFSDAETPDQLTYTIAIQNAELLQIQQNGNSKLYSEPVKLGYNDTLEIKIAHKGEANITITASDGVSTSADQVVIKVTATYWYERIAMYAICAAAGLLVLIIIILIVRQVKKPSFEHIQINCYAFTSARDDDFRAFNNETKPVSMKSFKKKGLTLTELLILTHQPALPAEIAAIADDIKLMPYKNDAVRLLFGAKAQKDTGRSKKECRVDISADEHYQLYLNPVTIELDNISD